MAGRFFNRGIAAQDSALLAEYSIPISRNFIFGSPLFPDQAEIDDVYLRNFNRNDFRTAAQLITAGAGTGFIDPISLSINREFYVPWTMGPMRYQELAACSIKPF